MKKNKFLLRIFTFLLGLFFMSFGVALSVKADLGVSPISCIPYVYSLKFPFTLGELTIVFNVVIIVLQVILLRKNYRLIQLVQLPIVFVFGFFIDLSMNLIADLNASTYAGQLIWCLLSCAALGFGVFLEVKAKITYLPGEGLALALATILKKDFGKMKVGVDSSMVILGLISSYIFLRHLEGIREGTIFSAILVGMTAKFFSKNLAFISNLLEPNQIKSDFAGKEKSSPIKNLILTISREYGSGGHEIGQIIAKKLDLSFYDKNLIKLTAEKSGFSTEYIQKNEQKLSHSLLFELYEQNYAYINEQHPPLDAIFLVQSKIIRDICKNESCVIVGRCSNFILKDNPDCFNVFIHAGNEYRKKKIIEEYGNTTKISGKELEKADRDRANYCLHYTGRKWNNAINYHMTIDSSIYGSEETANLIIKAVEKFNAN